MEHLEYNTILAVCDTIVGNVFRQLLIELPTVLDNIKCSISSCNKTTKCPIPVPYITMHIVNGNLNSLEEDIRNRILSENSTCHHVDTREKICNGLKSIDPIPSSIHLQFIELSSLSLLRRCSRQGLQYRDCTTGPSTFSRCTSSHNIKQYKV
ncbi:uncharacterized protein LOC111039805 [Myzus persicae]|uniref:uncharacterized protein LOC111039805 n=1 Tax=Myzus persicae TaxID=13164 RepID=UPI000B934972|nr:uncharacterized protein LOC111039805 [Myzus persicae]